MNKIGPNLEVDVPVDPKYHEEQLQQAIMGESEDILI